MKLRTLLASAALALTFSANAQTWVTDSAVMGAGYANDVYYSMKNGMQGTPVSNQNWHLAFNVVPQGPYGFVPVWANEATNSGVVAVYSLHLQASTHFASLSAADTTGRTGTPLYNSDTTWNVGAFNRENSPTDPYDFSWGEYDQSPQNTHAINGDSLYLIRIGTAGTPYKLWIKKYISVNTATDTIGWIFRIASFDNTTDRTITIHTADYPNRLFAYYNVLTNTLVNREPALTSWDILFTRYIAQVPYGPSTILPYPVTGVLSNFSTTVADVRGVKADTAHYQNYAFTRKLGEIGYDWVNFNMTTFMYQIDTTATFFVKTTNTNEYWQMQFTGFYSSRGTAVFRKRLITTTAVANVTSAVNAWYLVPNPATNNASLMIDAKAATDNARLVVTDLTGKMMQQATVSLHAGINAYSFITGSWPAGTYIVHVAGENLSIGGKLVVSH